MDDVIYELFCYLLFQPVPLFPSYSGLLLGQLMTYTSYLGICLGWLSHLGRTFCYYGFVGYVLVFAHMLWSLTVSFFYRYRVLAPIEIKHHLEHKLVIPTLF